MKNAKRRRPTGELRRTQLLTTYGPGSMVDLPDHAVLIGGLESWDGDLKPVYEPRLEAHLQRSLGVPRVVLKTPPAADDDERLRRSGVTAFQFPTWFLGQVDMAWEAPDKRTYRTRPLIPWIRLIKGKYEDQAKKKHPVVPVRFVQACVNGHISDVDWYAFVRNDFQADWNGQLWLDEGGAGNDFAEIYVRCERTGLRRPLSEAMVTSNRVLGTCPGRMPWLGPKIKEECDQPGRLLVRSASNAYFSQTMSVISIPEKDAKVQEAVDRVFEDYLQYAKGPEDIAREREKPKVFHAIEDISDEDVWAEVSRRKSGLLAAPKGIKQAEIETLLSAPATNVVESGDRMFCARRRDISGLPSWLTKSLDRVVLVHRLREVMTLIGFTRFEPVMPDIQGELDLEVRRAPISRDNPFFPAVEHFGQGVFLAFSNEAIQEWLAKEPVKERGRSLEAGFTAWLHRKNREGLTFPGLPYIMLHSLSHLLITAVALECGYSASSIKERIYAGPYGHGILLYTGSAGSEGTLGGLVEVGRTIEQHLENALRQGALCSNDPVCGEHDPADLLEERFLHGAACHGCLLIAETSCEQRNEYLDRALVVPTLATPGAAFFDEGDLA